MTGRENNMGFAGLEGLVSDVDKVLDRANRRAQRSSASQPEPESSTASSDAGRHHASPRQPEKTTPPPAPADAGGGMGRIWLGFAAFISFIVWATYEDGGTDRRSGSSSTSYTRPSTSERKSTPTLPSLSIPPIGINNIHSVAEIRYCLAADIRIEALRPQMNSNSQIDVFNDIVSDYNSRCGNYRYRQGALERARREVEPYRSAIISNAWDGVSLARKSPSQQSAPVQRSQLTTDIQKALTMLGYDPGVADGVYGQNTRAAIEAFQRDTGLVVNGRESPDLLRAILEELGQP